MRQWGDWREELLFLDQGWEEEEGQREEQKVTGQSYDIMRGCCNTEYPLQREGGTCTDLVLQPIRKHTRAHKPGFNASH